MINNTTISKAQNDANTKLLYEKINKINILIVIVFAIALFIGVVSFIKQQAQINTQRKIDNAEKVIMLKKSSKSMSYNTIA